MKLAKQKLAVLLLALITVVSSGVSAHDIDIYVAPTNANNTSAPLVMFSIDTRANTGSQVCGGTECNFLRSTEVVNGATLGPYLPASGSVNQFVLLKAVLQYVLDRTSGIKVGLMASHNNENNCVGPRPASPTNAQKCSNGGYILSGFQPITSRADFNAKLAAMVPADTGNMSHAYQGREMFFELFRYLTGQGVYNGHNGWTDLGSNTTTNMNTSTDTAYPIRWDAGIENGTADPNALYTSPLVSNCSKVYTVNIMFGVSNQDADSDTAITAAKGSGGIGVNTASTTPYSSYTEGFAQITRWLYNTDLGDGTWGTVPNLNGVQNVTSYFVTANDNVKTRQYASAGAGASSGVSPYTLSSDPSALATTLTNIFKQILSVSTSFSSPSVAVNTFNRAQSLNDFFVAMFMADRDGRPRWNGNIKKLKIGSSGLLDAADLNAIAADGRIEYSAVTFWTDPATLPAPDSTLSEVANKDGRSVARGGCGQRVPSYVSGTIGATNPVGTTTLTSARKTFTEPATYTAGTPTTLMPLEANTTTANALFSPTNYFGASTTVAGSCNPTTDTDGNSACNLIKFARGYTEVYDTTTQTTTTTKLNWLFADPLHSKPLAINYGTANGHSTTNPDVRLLVGTNDGFMRMIRNVDSGGNQEGIESWAFMPREVLPILSTLRQNTPTSPLTHPVTMDGSPSAYIYDANADGTIDTSTDKVYVFFGMRRGGTSYYALDITSPESPKILWKITKGASGTDFAELGQTWSAPRPARMLVDGSSTPTPVLIFAGGYDPNKDTHPPHVNTRTVGTDDSQGNAIFIVNLQTGALIWKAVKGNTTGYTAATKAYTHPGLLDSIPSDITVVDSNSNGLIDRLYVGDTGGVLWRVDLACANPNGTNVDANGAPTPGCGDATSPKPWSIVPLMSVGRHYSNTLANDRRFFYPPDYVQTIDNNGVVYDAIPIGTGDREDPTNTDTINYFYMYKDKDTASSVLTNYTTSGMVTHGQMTDITDCVHCTPFPAITYGWRLKLECPFTSFATPCGEKNLALPVTSSGIVYFSTFTPGGGANSTTCALSEGSGVSYGVTLQDGQPSDPASTSKLDRGNALATGGIPSEMVIISTTDSAGNKVGMGCTGTSCVDIKADSSLRAYWGRRINR